MAWQGDVGTKNTPPYSPPLLSDENQAPVGEEQKPEDTQQIPEAYAIKTLEK